MKRKEEGIEQGKGREEKEREGRGREVKGSKRKIGQYNRFISSLQFISLDLAFYN